MRRESGDASRCYAEARLPCGYLIRVSRGTDPRRGASRGSPRFNARSRKPLVSLPLFRGAVRPSDPACRAAIDLGGTQPIIDWNGVRQGSARSQHRDVVPYGEHCSGGKPAYRGLDLLRDDWAATPITPASDGTFDFLFYATALHRTTEWLFFVTPEGFDPTEALGWDDLEQFCRSGEVPVDNVDGKSVYRIPCALPPRTGRQIIYSIWQANSGEATWAESSRILGQWIWQNRTTHRPRTQESES